PGLGARPRRRGDRMKRREFITLIGGATAWPLAARGQQRERMRQIGVLMGWPESDPEARLERAAFVQELQKLGWLDGRKLRIDTRWASPAAPESRHRYAREILPLRAAPTSSQRDPDVAARLQAFRTLCLIFALAAAP